jgi:hypothetical protein
MAKYLSFPEMEIDAEKSSDGVSSDKLSFSDNTISSPFIVTVAFRMDQQKQSCLFSLEDDSGIKLALCFTPVGPTLMRIRLIIGTDKVQEASFTSSQMKKNEWMTLLFLLKDNEVTMYVNCIEFNKVTLTTPVKELYLPPDMMLYVGRAVKHVPVPEVYEVRIVRYRCSANEQIKFLVCENRTYYYELYTVTHTRTYNRSSMAPR